NNIWQTFVSTEELTKIFNTEAKRNKVSYENIYAIITKAGISLMSSTFKAYCNFDINNDKHYFFRETSDLLAIGLFVGNEKIIDSYEDLNDIGKQATVLLKIIGRSISRVVSGKIDPLN